MIDGRVENKEDDRSAIDSAIRVRNHNEASLSLSRLLSKVEEHTPGRDLPL